MGYGDGEGEGKGKGCSCDGIRGPVKIGGGTTNSRLHNILKEKLRNFLRGGSLI